MTEGKKKGFLAAFPLTYWVAIFLEFLERGAYYGMNAVLAVYLNEKLGFTPESVGFLQGFVYALTYVVPIAGGALAGLAIVGLRGFEIEGLEIGPRLLGTLADNGFWAMGFFVLLCYSLYRFSKRKPS